MKVNIYTNDGNKTITPKYNNNSKRQQTSSDQEGIFFCLGFIVPLENLYTYILIWRRHQYGEGLQILTYARHSWREGFLACRTYCDTGHPFIMVISYDPWHLTCCRAFSSVAVTTCFKDSGVSRPGFEHPTFRLRGQRSNPLRHHRGNQERSFVS